MNSSFREASLEIGLPQGNEWGSNSCRLIFPSFLRYKYVSSLLSLCKLPFPREYIPWNWNSTPGTTNAMQRKDRVTKWRVRSLGRCASKKGIVNTNSRKSTRWPCQPSPSLWRSSQRRSEPTRTKSLAWPSATSSFAPVPLGCSPGCLSWPPTHRFVCQF